MPVGILKENPRYNVVSLRVSDEDLKILKRLVTREQITISDLLRDALEIVRQRLEEAQSAPSATTTALSRRRTTSH